MSVSDRVGRGRLCHAAGGKSCRSARSAGGHGRGNHGRQQYAGAGLFPGGCGNGIGIAQRTYGCGCADAPCGAGGDLRDLRYRENLWGIRAAIGSGNGYRYCQSGFCAGQTGIVQGTGSFRHGEFVRYAVWHRFRCGLFPVAARHGVLSGDAALSCRAA